MSDDADLTRAFAQQPELPADPAFVARVTRRIAWRRRLNAASPLAAALLLVFAIWASWPAAYTFSSAAFAGIGLIGDATTTFVATPIGAVTVAVLLAAGLFWAWLYETLRDTAL